MCNFQHKVKQINETHHVTMKCLFENYCIIIIIIVRFCQILKECETVLKFQEKNCFVVLTCNNKVITVHPLKAYRAVDM